ncbi:MAG: cation transporter [Candidatus Mcinerneyibacterium aminivorans]|jgi:cation diffusion facilitator family transporter|uniref:Cation transporter n=1 Tax=Candidatus Mcinerneyibacterium aminivorans TaxID=2703815 RepID=A0A5D0MID0_9BACT|nr:MAG: cation transporter [Candidatus Mcinerneyibacterium aminivorans]
MEKLLTRFLIFISRKKDFSQRKYWGKFEGFLSIIFNIVLFMIKLTVGIISNSIAIIADAVHTLSDIVSSAGIIWGFNIAYQPPDEKHPFGHGRFEHILTLGVSFLLFYTGIEFVKESVKSIKNPSIVEFNLWLFLSIFATIIIKELMARLSLIIGKKIDSDALIADGYHHRTDVLSTVVVIFTFFIKNIDGYLGIIVSLFIIYSAYEVAKEAVNNLIGTKPSKEFIHKLKEFVINFEGVEGIHDIIVNKYGDTYIVSFHMEIDINYSLDEAHDLSERLEDSVDDKFNIKSIVHIDPIDKNDEEVNKVRKILKGYFDKKDIVDSFHDVRKIGKRRVNIVFDITVKEKITKEEEQKIYSEVKKMLMKEVKNFHDVVIKVEPLYAY